MWIAQTAVPQILIQITKQKPAKVVRNGIIATTVQWNAGNIPPYHLHCEACELDYNDAMSEYDGE